MMQVKTQLTGFEELLALTKELPTAMESRVYDTAVRASTQPTLRAVKANAPRGEQPSAASRKYGRLVRNLKVRRWRKRRRGVVGYTVSTGRGFWGWFVEYGTRFIHAQPWFRPAFDNTAPQAFDVMRDGMLKGLEREVKRLAGKYKTVRRALLRG